MKTKVLAILSVCAMYACTSGGKCNQVGETSSVDSSGVVRELSDDEVRATDDTLTIALVGDIMPGTTYPKKRLPENGGRLLFKDACDLLKTADIAAGNLEGALCDTGKTEKEKYANAFAFRIPTSYGKLLSDAGFAFLSLANNHSLDFGMPGMRSTEHVLDSCGIAYAGIAGRSETAVIERDGVRYGFCAFGHNNMTLKHADTVKVRRILTDLRQKCDIMIVSFHGGAEGKSQRHLPDSMEVFLGEKRGHLRPFAHLCIDCGADIVYGHGPHVARCVEVYRGRFIAYSLGNFCTPYGISITGVSGYAPLIRVRLRRDGSFIDGCIHSFIQHYGLGPRTDKTFAVPREIRSLTQQDIPDSKIRITDDGSISLSETTK